MQTIQFNSIINPTRFPSPSTISESRKFSQPRPAKTPRAVSTSTPDHNNKNITTSSTLGLVDSTSAYWDYQFLFVSQRSETAAPISLRVVDGAIPPEFPSGTYYLTGPGMFTDDHGSTVHPLDGHGYLRAFEFDMGTTGEVKFMAKYVRTEAQVEEHDPRTDTWRFTHRGPFSVLKRGKKFGNTKVMKNVANTSVLKWGGKLLCLWEGGDPYEIESGTLDTIGRFEVIDGRDSFPDGGKRKSNDRWDVAAEMLKPILYGVFKMPPKRLLSHYKLDTRRNRLLTVSCKAEDMLLPRSNFTFYEFDSNFKLLQKQDFDIPDHLMIHDWAFTDTHYILFGNRIKLDVLGSVSAVCGLSAMISALTVNPSKPTSSIYLIPRFPTESVEVRDWRVPVEAPSQMWLLHVANAYEIKDFAGNSHIQIHACSCSYQWFNFQNLFGYNWHSGRLDPSSMNVKESEYELLPQLVQVVEEQSFSITSKREEKCMNELETRVQDLEKKNYELEERLSTLQNENQIHRHTTVSINLDANGNCQECSVEPLNQLKKSSDFPIINPTFSGKKNTCIYAAASSGSRRTLPHFPFDTVLKLNVLTKSVATWTVGARRFIGEPIFVPKGVEEDDGYLLVIEYAVSIQRCFLVILDPKRIGQADALVARLEVPRDFNFPLGFHGFWAEQN